MPKLSASGLLVLGFLFLAAASTAAGEEAQQSAIARLTGGTLVAIEGSDQRRALVVSAEVSTAGWTDPTLTRAQYIAFPRDGLWDVFATAAPPDGMAAQVISPIVLALDVTDDTADVKGYRIHGAENCLIVLVDPEHVPPSDGCTVLGR